MKRLAMVFVFLSLTGAVYGQNTTSGLLNNLIGALPPVSTVTNSVIDHNGNLLMFDVSYSYQTTTNQATAVRLPPVVKTHVTVIAPTAVNPKTSFDYAGALQIVGIGGQAVYAIDSSYTSTNPLPPIAAPGGGVSTGGGTTIVPTPIVSFIPGNFRLVALNVVAGSLPAPLPSINTLVGADVKISAGAGTAPDTIAVINLGCSPATANAPTAGGSHSVQFFTFDDVTLFKPINATPICVP
jgi:hypothetical protein